MTTVLYFKTTFSFELNIASCRTLRKQNTANTATPNAATIPATHTATKNEIFNYRKVCPVINFINEKFHFY